MLLLLLTGCITRPVPPPAVIESHEAGRLAFLHAHPDWSFSGRVALRQHGKGGSGRIDWQQQGSHYRIRLSAPVTRQSWQLIGDTTTGHARIEGIEGGPLAHTDAEALLLEATGWDIPVLSLPLWVRGISDTINMREAATRPHIVQQHGWNITWPAWHPASDSRPELPRRIEAVRDGDTARIRLIVDQWVFP